MIPVLSCKQMRAFDKHAIESCHVPSLLLMENAGRGATDIIERELCGGRARSSSRATCSRAARSWRPGSRATRRR